ncbi:hypothetical protein [Staphylococcus pasteuri]|uniref:hypothetical protein n=1 Tax=Staphylococcus pasteuri TaxID=45972 RepID=UPI001C26341C|nr:hypothetical protein [Staphylococcus pasteuri]MCO0862317.1 hypothetical protein [Staphylococcus pasteuri]
MIEAKPSQINDAEDWFPSIKQISISLNALKNRSRDVYINALDLVNGISRDLLRAAKNDYENYQEIEDSINNKIEVFILFSDEISNKSIDHFINSIKKSIRIIIGKCKKLEEQEVNKIRGLLTEAIACSFLGDVSQPNAKRFLWDCLFYKDNELLYINNANGNQIYSTDIYYFNNVICLCECKTTPHFKTYQVEFMEYIKQEYQKEGNDVQLYVFVLNYSVNPSLQNEMNKLTDNFKLKTLDDIKEAI